MGKLSPEELSQASERLDSLFPGERQTGGQRGGDAEQGELAFRLAAPERRLQKASNKLDEVDSADAQKLLQVLQEAVAKVDEQAFEENARELDDILFFAGGWR